MMAVTAWLLSSVGFIQFVTSLNATITAREYDFNRVELVSIIFLPPAYPGTYLSTIQISWTVNGILLVGILPTGLSFGTRLSNFHCSKIQLPVSFGERLHIQFLEG
jgi:hypothetical protein